ncbi:barstar family protein [Halothiobacillus sp.]|uniref:barstar family protein n=1 Tax=Halothiobacillus sp. TaxID=1891311 RepID=UPI002AD30AE1|nr:barstar family protein [Halothiobacillus sp.]
MKIEILGDRIACEQDFHKQLAQALGVQKYYGHNLDALWDLLSTSVERPAYLVWTNSAMSKKVLGDTFEKIVAILERVRLQDEGFGWEDKFTYNLD